MPSCTVIAQFESIIWRSQESAMVYLTASYDLWVVAASVMVASFAS